MTASKKAIEPLSQSTDSMRETEVLVRGGLRSYVWPSVLTALLLLVLAAFRPLALPDEGRYAEIGRWMGVSGDWLAPRLNGLPFFHKPPLLYWLEAMVSQSVGASAWAFRLIPAFHAILILTLMGPWVQQVMGPAMARRSVIIFGTSAAFLMGGQYINHDMMVACWISVAIGAFGNFAIHASAPEKDGVNVNVSLRGSGLQRTAWIGFIALALGVLSKGLIGVVLPAWVLFLWLCWSGRWSALKAVPWISGLLIFMGITLPWFILTERAYPGMLDYMFGVHQFARFTGTQFNNAQPVWFYVAAISLLLGLWMVWFWAYQIRVVYDFWVRNEQESVASKFKQLTHQFMPAVQVKRTNAQLLVGLCVVWVWAIVVFFSIPNSKIIGYVLPVTPPMSVLCALGWERLMRGSRFEKYIWQILVVSSVLLMVLINDQATKWTERHFTVDIAKVLGCQDLSKAQIMVVGEYPYDLPFLLALERPLWVLQDWDFERTHAGDNWRRELFEGANFEPSKGEFLKPLSTLAMQAGQGERWLLAPKNWSDTEQLKSSGYLLVSVGSAWNVYRTQTTQLSPTSLEGTCLK